MKVVNHCVQEEGMEAQLRTRRRRPDLADPSGENTASLTNDGHKTEEEVDKNETAKNSVYYDKNEGTTLQLSLSGKNLKAEDHGNISKLMINDVINHQNGGNREDELISGSSTSSLRSEEQNKGNRKTITIDLEEGIDEEIELEFEEVHTHTPFCPRCQNEITKVILRRKKKDSPAPVQAGVDAFGCLKCLRVFILSGTCLNPFRCFGWIGRQDSPKDVPGGGSTSPDGNPAAVKPPGSDGVQPGGDANDVQPTSQKPGLRPEIPPKDPYLGVGYLAIPIPPKPGGGIGGVVTSPAKPGEEKPEEPGAKPPRRPGTDEENPVGTTPHELPGTGTGAAAEPEIPETRGSKSLEILKCIVYGGLIESITSLSVVSSAAASDASTLNVVVMGLATLFSGLIVFGRNLVGLKNDASGDRYQEQLGMRENFLTHATFAVLSYLAFGLIPPITYGFTFRESDNKDYKILAVAAASLACVFVLAIAKAHVRRPEKFSEYAKTVLAYITMAIGGSGVSYAAGDLIKMLMEKLGWFEPTQAANTFFPEMISATPAWASN